MAQVHSFALSERGLRDTNDDAFTIEKAGEIEVFAVAGGKAGRPAGRDAGRIAVDAVRNAVMKEPLDPVGALEAAVRDADARIGALIGKDRKRAGMGTELCACLVDANLDCTILDTGHGGVYYISPGIGIVIPHEIPFSETIAKPVKKTIVSHTLGEPHVIRGTEFSRVNLMNSFMVLASEGLYDYVRREEIRSIVERNGENIDTSCEELKNKALLAGSEQTITMIILHGHIE